MATPRDPANTPVQGPVLGSQEKNGTNNHEDESDPVVVVGFAARLPGEAATPEGFWKILFEGRNTSTEVPKDRANIDAYYHPNWERPDTTNVRRANFIDGDVAAFDAPFFSIQPIEAESMDPQQRILLETAYQALENAGIPLEAVAGTDAGVFVAASNRDYESMLFRDTERAPKYMGTGIGTSLLANRISWAFDLRGPSVPVDTACSGSLTALHFAHQSLKDRNSSLVLVGGVSLILAPDASMTQLSTLGFLSPDGISYSFDSRANGYAKGEGAAVVVLKRLSDAIRDNDTIRAVLRATALNQDGRTPGITQPSQVAQTANIRRAYGENGLDLNDTGYFEAHGTGTVMGDLIEANAIYDAFQRPPSNPIHIGSLKANIGHMEAVAGAGALIKSILVLEEGILPPNAYFEHVNPSIPEEKWGIKFLREPKLFPAGRGGVRRISVNNFGYGGANAHAVLDDASSFLKKRGLRTHHCTVEFPSVERHRDADLQHPRVNAHDNVNGTGNPCKNGVLNGTEHASKSVAVVTVHKSGTNGVLAGGTIPADGTFQLPVVLPWSSADESGVDRVLKQFDDYLKQVNFDDKTAQDEYLRNLCYTLSVRRSHLPWKSFTVVRDMEGLSKGISTVAQARFRSSSPPSISFIFTGQGAQYFTMARRLEHHPVFATSLNKSEAHLRDLNCGWSLKDELARDKMTSRVNDPELSQPLCTALQIALVDTLEAWNVRPVAVAGHSSGEIAAAYCAKAISHATAIKIAYLRGQVVKKLTTIQDKTQAGGMLAVALGENEAERYIEEACQHTGARASIGCMNSPSSMTITGDVEALNHMQTALRDAGTFAKRIQVSVAYHSHHMEKVAADYLEALGELPVISHQTNGDAVAATEKPQMFSSVTGERMNIPELTQPAYWVRNLVSRVRFTQAIQSMTAHLLGRRKTGGDNIAGRDVLVEIGPHSALQMPIKDIIQATTGAKNMDYEPSLSRNVEPLTSLANLAGTLASRGVPVDLLVACTSGDASVPRLLHDLPKYPFNYSKTYWCESRISKNRRFRKSGRHELLGTQEPDWNPLRPRWRNLIRLDEQPWIKEHKFGSFGIYPATGILVMALEGVRQLVSDDNAIDFYEFENVAFLNAFIVPFDSDIMEAQLQLCPLESASEEVATYEFAVFGLVHDEWKECCKGRVSVHLRKSPDHESTSFTARHRHLGLEPVLTQSNGNDWKTVGDNMFYRNIDAMGYTFGQTFQSLSNIRYNQTGQAVATIMLDKWAEKIDVDPPTSHVIHPVDLDSFLQTAVVAHSRGSTSNCPVFIPTSMKSLRISHSLLDRTSGDILTWVGKRMFEGLRETDSILGAVDAQGKPCMVLEGYRATHFSIASAELDVPSQPGRLAYHIHSKPDVDFLDAQSAQKMCESSIDPSCIANEYIDKLELVAMFHLQKSMEAIHPDDVERMPEHLKKYMAWAKHCFNPKTLHDLRTSTPENEQLFGSDDQKEVFLDTLLKRGAEGRLVVETGRELVSILKGQSDALDLLFTTDLARDWYNSPMFSLPVERMMPFVDLLAHKNPSLDILEVGAGTGGATRRILRSLSDYSKRSHHKDKDVARYKRYTFTDISSAFFDAAQVELGGCSAIEYMTLDIGRDPSTQGFADRQYDLILCGAVLHATPDLKVTLSNIRKLLKPGGRLIMVEPTAYDTARASFTFGLVPGWWLSVEKEREYCPCISVRRWHELLLESGFHGVDFSVVDHAEDARHLFSGMVAIANDSAAPQESPLGLKILASESSETQRKVAQHLQKSLSAGTEDVSIVSEKALITQDLNLSDWIVLLELDGPFFDNVTSDSWAGFQKMVASSRSILWVKAESDSSLSDLTKGLTTGIGRNVLSEYPAVVFSELSLQFQGTVSNEDTARTILKVHERRARQDPANMETELVQSNQQLCIPRFVANADLNRVVHDRVHLSQPDLIEFGADSRALELTMTNPGLLETLQFRDDVVYDQPLGPTEVEIEVEAAGVNTKDMMIASGQLSGNTFGLECAGVVTRAGTDSQFQPGDRVCGCVSTGAYKTFARVDSSALIHIPEHLSFNEAAGIPLCFATAYYSIISIANLTKGESVLILGAAGDVGQAAVQIAQRLEAKVLLGVQNDEQHQLLTQAHGIAEDHVFVGAGFTEAIWAMYFDGIDVVLNTQAGSKQAIADAWKCVAPLGRFVELGEAGTGAMGLLHNRLSNSSVNYSLVNFEVVMEKAKPIMRKIMKYIATVLVDTEHAIRAPQPLATRPVGEIAQAFRENQEGGNIGKYVIEINPGDKVQVTPSLKPGYAFDPNATYVIAGGLGGLARTIIEWMVSRNAKHFLLLSRSGAENNAVAQALIQRLRLAGVSIHTPRCDITDGLAVAQVFSESSESLPPIKGCIQGAMVLKDGILEHMSSEDLHAATRPKVQGTINLAKYLPAQLDFFVMLSSISGAVGTQGQGNYAAANTFQDAFARRLASEGRHCISLNLGVILNVGYAAERDLVAGLHRDGFQGLAEGELMALLEYACDPQCPAARDPERAQIVSGLLGAETFPYDIFRACYWTNRPICRYLMQLADCQAQLSGLKNSAVDSSSPSAILAAAADDAEAAEAATLLLVDRIASLLNVPVADIDTRLPIAAFGIDSLISLELKNWIARELKANASVLDIMGAAGIEDLAGLVVGKTTLRSNTTSTEAQGDVGLVKITKRGAQVMV